ncbi:MAG: Fe-S cluster assembly ATPase SufC [bacterium]|nr:Fe-S cluster assembly ATPase SufC [bacterium]
MTPQQHNQTGLSVKDFSVSVNGTRIVNRVSLAVQAGTIHILMGPNGSGKSSLLYALMGHPCYVIEEGEILLNENSVTMLAPEERARLGLFLSFQHPVEVSGVSFPSFLRAASNAIAIARGEEQMAPAPFVAEVKEHANTLDLSGAFMTRSVNVGFSGGEKKKAEIIQLLTLKPSIALLDEIDSGLDIDAVRMVCDVLGDYQKQSGAGILLVTHNPRILNLIKPDAVSVMVGGRIVASGGEELAEKIEQEGFRAYE